MNKTCSYIVTSPWNTGVVLQPTACDYRVGRVLSECHMFCFMLSASSLCGQVLLVSLVSCLVLSSCLAVAFSLFVRTQGSEVLRSLLPTSLFEHLSMGQVHNPPTLGTTLCVSRALMPTLAVKPPHVCHRQRLGSLHRLTHAAGHGHF